MYKPVAHDGSKSFIFPPQCQTLKLLGLWPLEKSEPNLTSAGICYRVYCVWTIILIFTICTAQFLFITHNFTDIIQVTECCCTVLMGLHNFIRVVHLFLMRNKLKNVITSFVSNIWISKSENEVMHNICERESIIMKAMSVMLTTLITMYVTLPILETLTSPDLEEKPFPYKMWFPFDTQTPLSYGLTYLFSSWAGICVVTTLFAEDSLFCYFIVHTCGKLKILHKSVDELMDTACDNVRKKHKEVNDGFEFDKLVEEEFDVLLRDVVETHNVIIEFCKKLEELFSPIFLVNFMVSSFIICMVGFQIVIVKMSIGDFFKLVIYIFSALNQLFILCWYGDKLIYQSGSLAPSLYLCGWHNLVSYKVAKSLILPIYRCQRPLRITAYKFSVLSLPSFATILSSSMSYFTLLRTLVETD